jgi:two-component system phosphate regulon response regulator PhoB
MASSEAKTALLIDDDTSNLEAFGDVLRDAGYTVVCARNGAEALACLPAAHPNVVMVDYVMPRMDGATTVQMLRRHDATRDVSIIMTSGLPEEVVRPCCQDYDVFLRKPLDIAQALQALQTLAA